MRQAPDAYHTGQVCSVQTSTRVRIRLCAAVLALTVVLPSSGARAREWTQDNFENKVSAGRPFVAIAGQDPEQAHSVIGFTRFYQIRPKDTFFDVARYYDLGYNEIADANPGVDPWIPPAGQVILLPTEWVLPEGEYEGVVVNIPEMRLYYFHPTGEGANIVSTFPVGLGRDDWRTPEGAFRIRGKTVNPKWVLPESIKAEHRRQGEPAPDFIAGGTPDNPLGKYRFELTMPLYAIHGTDIPWGVGMQVSHGCIRLYPEDIARLFPMVRVGTQGAFVYQPVKVGTRDGHIYVEVHKDIYRRLPGPYREALRLIDKFGWRSRVDLDRVKRAVVEQSGVPMDVTRLAGIDLVEEETLRPSVVQRRRQANAGNLTDEVAVRRQ
ncbi:MAG: L,D-transpeptidase family protein [Candidatus Binatia bacterium]